MILVLPQLTFTRSKSTIETPKKVLKYGQSKQKKHQTIVIEVVSVFLWLTLNILHVFLLMTLKK